jgi:hypothetical protein
MQYSHALCEQIVKYLPVQEWKVLNEHKNIFSPLFWSFRIAAKSAYSP